MKHYFLFIPVCLGLLSGSCDAGKDRLKSFTPGTIWPDNNGKHINAHGGGVLKSGNRYYWFGEHKIEGPAGNKAMVGVSCYSSADLYNWVDEGIALAVVENDTTHPITKGCVLERPKVIYNAKTRQYVMWFHLELYRKGYSAALTGLATSGNVTGPYTFVKALRPNEGSWPVNYAESLKNTRLTDEGIKSWTPEWKVLVDKGLFLHRDFQGGQMSRDMTLYVDEDGTAYHIHAAEDNLTLHISELTEDYLGFTGRYYRVFPGGHNEAPALFKHNNKYYMITSGCTGWDPNAARLAQADSITGEWTFLGNPCTGADSALTYHAQSTFVLPVDKDKFVFMADRWNPENAVDGRYIWLPVQFSKDNRPYLDWKDEWEMRTVFQ